MLHSRPRFVELAQERSDPEQRGGDEPLPVIAALALGGLPLDDLEHFGFFSSLFKQPSDVRLVGRGLERPALGPERPQLVNAPDDSTRDFL